MIIDAPKKPSDYNERSAMTEFRTPQGIRHSIPNMQAETHNHYVVEWGGRINDGALVFHFFPPIVGGKVGDDWPFDSTMDKRLEKAIPQVFDTSRITAGYEKDWQSFYIIAGGYASSLDARLLVKRFLDAIDAA